MALIPNLCTPTSAAASSAKKQKQDRIVRKIIKIDFRLVNSNGRRERLCEHWNQFFYHLNHSQK